MKRIIFSCVFVLLATYVSGILAHKNMLPSCAIKTISNMDGEGYQLNLDKGSFILPPVKQTVRMNKLLVIPFISIKHYLRKYVKDVPYIPPGALKLSKNHKYAKTLYIWQNESGVVCAQNPQNCYAADWKRQKLFNPKAESSHVNSLLALRLILDTNVQLQPVSD